jgi:glycosyltransferase involved in cell wall biosynthesis
MKVAMLTTVGDRCGIAAYSRDLASSLAKLVDLTIVPIDPGKLSLEHYQEQAKKLNAADVVHIQHEHSFWGGILPNQSAFWNMRYLIQKPVVITAHTTTSLADLLRLKEERRLPHRIAKCLLVRRRGYRDSVEIAPFVTGRCIVHTDEGREALIARGANPKYVHVIPAGIPDLERAPTNGMDFREKYHLEGKKVVALFGYLAPNKGYEVALDALSQLADDVYLVIAGGVRSTDMEIYASELKQRVRASGMDERVIMTGFLSDSEVAEAMAVADLVIAPHTYATGSYSITIPLAYGKATIASDQACFREIADECLALEIVPTGDPTALADAIRRLFQDEPSRKALEERARVYAAQRTWGEVAELTVEVYREAIEDVDRLAHHKQPAARG